MNLEPLVTIITSCYNHEKYLDDYFKGLLCQTYRNIELIIFDDGSTDGSWLKILSYEPKLREKFARVVCERHENMGGGPEGILALDQARGELLCLLDSDDYYQPTKVEENVRYLQEHPEAGAVHSDVDYVFGDRIQPHHWRAVRKRIVSGDIFEALLVDNFIMTCSFCCRTNLFRKYASLQEYLARGYAARDYAFFLDLARHTKFGYIDKSLAHYRVLNNSASHVPDLQKAFNLEKGYQQIKLDYIEKYEGSDRARRLAIEGMYQAHFLFGFRMHRVDQCLEAYGWLMKNNPVRFGKLPFRILALSIRNKLLWRLVVRIEAAEIVQRAVLKLFSLRNRGQSQIN